MLQFKSCKINIKLKNNHDITYVYTFTYAHNTARTTPFNLRALSQPVRDSCPISINKYAKEMTSEMVFF